jgi:ribosomal protein L21E
MSKLKLGDEVMILPTAISVAISDPYHGAVGKIVAIRHDDYVVKLKRVGSGRESRSVELICYTEHIMSTIGLTELEKVVYGFKL